ncbi:PAS domain-containing protein [Streptomyces canus]|uniref:PAS domain-containing protein n=1 Tax=Streptomyces canus TaxID=58343 RepID=UPI0037242959
MVPGLCEMVLHDLRDPRHAIRVIENNLSGRRVGDSATEPGLARIADPEYPSVLEPPAPVPRRPPRAEHVHRSQERRG